jgi:fructan beta-fructosidase
MAAWLAFGMGIGFGVLAVARDAEPGPRPDLVVADFEGESYAPWTAEGAAFGAGPARGTLPHQMAVDGFEGKALASSFHGGDGSVGTLTSPPFRVERPYLNLLIGGGKDPQRLRVELIREGKPVRSLTGPNDRPGGSERLGWQSWDVSEFQGQRVSLRVVDEATGGWGHLSVDQVVQGDRRRGQVPATREVVADRPFLLLPVKNGAPSRRLRVLKGDALVRELDVELADGPPDFRVPMDLRAFAGQTLRLETTLPEGSRALDAIEPADADADPATLYREALRPRFHFTARRGWLNDPNGLVWHDGEYHLFFQHNPYGREWGNMHWGHAVSADLVHWRELPLALYPRTYGDWCFSGSAVVDRGNTSGFGADGRPPLVLAYTSTDRGECIAWSRDRGRTWTEYEGNPVVRHEGRDPRLVWHEESRSWVMAVYDETDGRRDIVFHTSPDLKRWTERSRIGGFFECPDLVRLPVAGRPGEFAWVLYGADGAYLTGDFDGATFTPRSDKQRLWYGNFYAAQTFTNVPDGRCIQIGWGRGITFPGMPFNQQMVVPVSLSLRRDPDALRLVALPVAELAALAEAKDELQGTTLRDGEAIERPLGEASEVNLVVDSDPTATLELRLRGVMLRYDAAKRELSCGEVTMPVVVASGPVTLRILQDRGSVEVFASEGRSAMSVAAIADAKDATIRVAVRGGGARVPTLSIATLRSSWEPPPSAASR